MNMKTKRLMAKLAVKAVLSILISVGGLAHAYGFLMGFGCVRGTADYAWVVAEYGADYINWTENLVGMHWLGGLILIIIGFVAWDYFFPERKEEKYETLFINRKI